MDMNVPCCRFPVEHFSLAQSPNTCGYKTGSRPRYKEEGAPLD